MRERGGRRGDEPRIAIVCFSDPRAEGLPSTRAQGPSLQSSLTIAFKTHEFLCSDHQVTVREGRERGTYLEDGIVEDDRILDPDSIPDLHTRSDTHVRADLGRRVYDGRLVDVARLDNLGSLD